MYRRQMSRREARKRFSSGNRHLSVNYSSRLMRGGYRL